MSRADTMPRTNTTSHADTKEPLVATQEPYTPAQNIEAEQSTLGAMLIEQSAIDQATELLEASDFYRPAHQVLFETITALSRRNEPVDLITVQNALKAQSQLESIGGMSYLMALGDVLPSAVNVGYYAKIVADKSRIRGLADTARRAFVLTRAPDADADTIASVLRSGSEGKSTRQFDDLESGAVVLERLRANMTARAENPNALAGLPTGLDALDSIISGLKTPNLVVIGGRPGQGKSALLTTMIQTLTAGGAPCILFTMEMSNEEAVQRMICTAARLDSRDLERGQLTEEEWVRFDYAANVISSAPFMACDASGLTPAKLRARLRQFVRQHGRVGVMGIDFTQLMEADRATGNRVSDLTDVSKQLKAIAKEFDCPVIALASLSRACEGREDKRPVLSDLRETGQIESDADIVLFVYNQDIYAKELTDKPPSEARMVELIVRKNRGGPLGTAQVGFVPKFTRFENWVGGADGYDDPASDAATGF